MSISIMTKVWPMAIPATAKLVLLSLADQANDKGVCWPSQPKIALRCSLSDRAVREQLGWLESIKAFRREVKVGLGTIYILTVDECTEPRNIAPPRNDLPPRNNLPPTPEDCSANPGTTFRQIISKQKEPPKLRDAKKQRRACSPTASESADDGFAAFWQQYPKKVAKPKALKAWKNLKPAGQLLADLMAGLQWQKASADWLKDGGQFVPHPATWLNGRRWEDEVQPAANQALSPATNPNFVGAV